MSLLCVIIPEKTFAQSFQTGILTHDGVDRTYLYYIPPKKLTAERGLPLLVALHGGAGSAEKYARWAGYRELAEKKGFILVYPDAMGNQWNDGRPAEAARGRSGVALNADDVGFISELIDTFVQHYQANPDKVFIEGSSNGGMMAQRLACEIPEKITAAASVIASMPVQTYKACRPSRPVGMLLMSGTQDELMPFSGGEVTVFGRSYGQVIGFDLTARFWAQQNGCRIPPETISIKDSNTKDGSTVTLDRYQGCRDHAALSAYKIHGGGHTRPGLQHARERRVGHTNQDISAPQIIWDFFESF